jgi:Domain of unknown function (DUF4338)
MQRLKADIGSILQSGREIKGEELEEIQETVALFPSLSRCELAHTICEHLGWFTASGSCKRDACLRLLERLEATGCVKLPAKRGKPPQKSTRIVFTTRTEPRDEICGSVGEIAPIRVELVKGREQRTLWTEYVSRFHYLGYRKPFGCSLSYFIESPHGLLGCLLFQGAAKALRVRDEWIGWTRGQRLRNLPWVINNSRFLIFPWVKIRNLGSHTLGQVVRRIRDDWEERWGYRPVLAESFVDPERYEGSSYKADNWQCLGITSGRGLARKGKNYISSPKKIFVRALASDFRALLCSEQLNGRVE